MRNQELVAVTWWRSTLLRRVVQVMVRLAGRTDTRRLGARLLLGGQLRRMR